jgi:DNA-binding transcriptional LysR family regulator
MTGSGAGAYPDRMDFRRLRYFVAVAEDLHFTNAAARLHLAQPALSQAIRQLEAELGATLLHRTRREVKLTYAGTVLLHDAKKLLSDVEFLERRVKAAEEGSIGVLRLGYVDNALYGALPQLLRAISTASPGVTVVLRPMSSAAMLVALEEDTLDIGLLRPEPFVPPAIAIEIIHRDPLVLAIPIGHPLAREDCELDMSAVEELDLIVPERQRDSTVHNMILDYMSKVGIRVNVVARVSSIQAGLSLVAGGMGVILMPKRVETWGTGHMVFRPVTPPPEPATLAVAWTRENPSPVTRDCVALALEMTIDDFTEQVFVDAVTASPPSIMSVSPNHRT